MTDESPQTQTQPETQEARMVRLALALMNLGVSVPVTRDLIAGDLQIVEQQLAWLPARRVRKPASFIVTAIRENYERPASLMDNVSSSDGEFVF